LVGVVQAMLKASLAVACQAQASMPVARSIATIASLVWVVG
jgi:hypothetical protein